MNIRQHTNQLHNICQLGSLKVGAQGALASKFNETIQSSNREEFQELQNTKYLIFES